MKQFIETMKQEGLSEYEIKEGLATEFGLSGDAASEILTPPPPKKNIADIFKNRPDNRASYTAENYEVFPGEFDAIHMECEQRHFDGRGKKISKPIVLKIDIVDWPDWLQRKGGQGYEINKILHRPASIAPIQVDDWDETEGADGKMVGMNRGEFL